jgi:hypothetical protein
VSCSCVFIFLEHVFFVSLKTDFHFKFQAVGKFWAMGSFISHAMLDLLHDELYNFRRHACRKLMHRTTQTQNKRRQTSMPRVGFEPKTPVFERAKTIHALRPVHNTRARATAYTHNE